CTATDTWTYRGFSTSGTLTAKGMVYINASSALAVTAAATNGQLLCGSTGAIPTLCTITSVANETLVTNGAGSITIGLAASVQHKAGANWLFTDTTDTTKKFQLDLSGLTTGTTRTFAPPDGNLTIPKTYVAMVTQNTTGAPVATVMDNNLGGTVVWARTSAGV